MTAPNTNSALAPQANSGLSSGDWAQILSSAANAAGQGFNQAASGAGSKREAKEAKRRTVADFLRKALNRNQALFRTSQEYGNEMNQQSGDAMQQVAQGFVNAFKGSTIKNRG